MDGLFEQMANISKAHGYDILAEQVGELKKENAKLAAALQPFIKLADAVLKDTLKTNESPLYGYNDVVIYVKDLVAAKEALNRIS